jgi:APA family basic amino acid/polyamine antiporter
VLFPWIDPSAWIIRPIHLSDSYALSLSTQQLVGILSIALLTAINTRGIRLGKLLQNVVTSTKTLALVAVIVLGIVLGRNTAAITANFSAFWDTAGAETTVTSRFSFLPPLSASSGALGLLVAFCVAQVGSLFSSDAWNNITFTAGEVKDPRRTVPRALAAGTGLVIALYLLANIAYLLVLPLSGIQHAPDDRVGTAVLGVIFGPAGATIMAIAIAVSTFGCNNGLILAGARVYYVMAKDGLFFRGVGRLNARRVPAVGLVAQGIWASLLILPRTRLGAGPGGEERYGNLYGNLLDYVVFAVLIFYVLTIAAIFVLRRTRPDAERPYRAWGYPVVPLLYIAAACVIMAVLVAYRSETTWPGLVIVLSGLPAYWVWTRLGASAKEPPERAEEQA